MPESMVTGAVVSGTTVFKATFIDLDDEFPAGSVSVIVKVLSPSVRLKDFVLSAPSTLYMTVMEDVFVVELSAGKVMLITGAIVSNAPVTDLDDELPRESVSVTVSVFEPSIKVKGFVLAVPSTV